LQDVGAREPAARESVGERRALPRLGVQPRVPEERVHELGVAHPSVARLELFSLGQRAHEVAPRVFRLKPLRPARGLDGGEEFGAAREAAEG
jgi:hypothetical protein